MKKIVALFSGAGSNLEAISKHLHHQNIAQIALAICNEPTASGIEVCRRNSVECLLVNHKDYTNRANFDAALLEAIEEVNTDLIVLAGFMRILGEEFVSKYQGKIINIHPSLLPKYKGLNTFKKALNNHDSTCGTTIHYVTNTLDSGPIIAQLSLSIDHEDNEQTLMQKVKYQEHILYPKVISWVMTGNIYLHNNIVMLNEHPLPITGVEYHRQ